MGQSHAYIYAIFRCGGNRAICWQTCGCQLADRREYLLQAIAKHPILNGAAVPSQNPTATLPRQQTIPYARQHNATAQSRTGAMHC
jgi:hypothetical protein